MSAISKKLVNTVLTAAMATALLAVATTADAQYQEHWKIEGQSWLSGGLTRGMAYNPATDNIVIATRDGGSNVLVRNAADGAAETSMDTTGITGGFFAINKIDVVDRGTGDYSVYAGALTLQAKLDTFGFGPFILYRWVGSGSAEESTIGPPTRIYNNKTADALTPLAPENQIGPPLPATTKDQVRVGDSLKAVYNSGTNSTRIYLGVSTAQTTNVIFVITVDEATGTVTGTEAITLIGQLGSTSYGPTVDSLSNIYYITNGVPSANYYDSDGNFLATFDSAVLANNSTQPRFMQYGGRSFLGVIDSSSTPTYNRARIVEVTAGVAAATLLTNSTGATTPVANANATGDVALDSSRNRFIALVTDNQLLSFSMEEPLLIELANFGVGVNEPSGTVNISWETASEIDNVGFNVYRLEKDANGATSLGGKVNPILIPGAGDGTQSGGSYTIIDTNVLAPGAERGYVLEDVDANGTATRHAPVFARRAATSSGVNAWPQF